MVTKFSFHLYSPSELTLHRASCLVIEKYMFLTVFLANIPRFV
jgi:hypothetical protein